MQLQGGNPWALTRPPGFPPLPPAREQKVTMHTAYFPTVVYITASHSPQGTHTHCVISPWRHVLHSRLAPSPSSTPISYNLAWSPLTKCISLQQPYVTIHKYVYIYYALYESGHQLCNEHKLTVDQLQNVVCNWLLPSMKVGSISTLFGLW